MPENIGATGAPYNTKIPRQDENADIQTALRLYHYGSDTNNPSSIDPDSISGFLDFIEQTKLSKELTALLSENLNTVTTTGFYYQSTAANAVANNYPTPFPGFLKVLSDGNVIVQEYHVIGSSTNIINKSYWRVQYASAWSAWQTYVTSSEVATITDALYHQKSVTWTRTEIAARYAPIYFTENAKTADHTIALADVNKVVSMNVAAGGTLTVPASSTTAFQVGSVVNVYNQSSNPLTIAGATGVTVRNSGTLEQYKEASLRYRGNDEWVAAGPLF